MHRSRPSANRPTAARHRRSKAARLAVEGLEGRQMMAQVDLGVTLTDGREIYEPGQPVRYTVVVTNAGPGAATAARVTNPLPAGTTGGSWTATYSPNATGPASGSGGLDATITLPAGGSAIFSQTVSVPATASGKLVGRATVAAGAGDSDTNAANDVAVDTDALPILVVANDAGAGVAPEVTVINPFTGAVRHRFLAYEAGFRGGVRVAVADVDADGVDEIVTASGSGREGEIRVFRQNGTELPGFRTQPYGGLYRGGVDVAAGDIDGDGDVDIVTTMSRGAGDVRVLRSEGTRAVLDPTKSFQPFADSFRGGATVAAADLDGDRKAEVILGSGPGATPAVLVYAVTGKPTLVDNFRPFAADPTFTGGVSVAAARIDTDRTPDIIVSGGRGAKSFFEIYDGRINAAVANARIVPRQAAFAGLDRANAAVALAMVDLDGDGQADRTFTAQASGGGFAGVKATAARATAPTLAAFTSPALRSGLQLAASAPRLDAGLVTTPSGLRYRDLTVGTGAVATAGKNLEVHYVLSYPNGAVDQSSRTGGAVFPFKLGVGAVIEGWDEGVAGMRVGGRRQLIVPQHLAYKGQAGRPAGTLVFDVELKSVT